MGIQSMQIGGDKYLLRDRRICAKQKMHLAKANIEAEGTPFPEPEEFCLAVLEETAKRKRTKDLYISISPENMDDLVLRIWKASLGNKNIIVSADNMPLPCSLAFCTACSSLMPKTKNLSNMAMILKLSTTIVMTQLKMCHRSTD